MKLSGNSTSTIVASQGVGVTSTFGIANNSHMFNILSSGLYSDKIGAVLREVGCNAMDAHIAAGLPDKPFQVKLPTELDRSFYIKDWGLGLDDDEVRNIYTTYGISTKQESDDMTGGFGLGSKSPFAYTLFDPDNPDGFTIVAVKNGKKRIYVAHLNDDGAPAVSDMGVFDADPDWPSGVMVSFPVQERDIREFHAKALEIFQWFRVAPEILGLRVPLSVPAFRFDNGGFFKMGAPGSHNSQEQRYHNVPAVVMGNVRYPIESSRLGELSTTMRALLKSGIHLFVPIGEVLMTPSRESLQYTDKTRRNILERLKSAAKEMAIRLRDDVMQPEPTKLAWFRKIQQYVVSVPFEVRNHIGDFLLEAGVEPDQVKVIREMVSTQTLELPRWAGDGVEGSPLEYVRLEDGSYARDAHGNRMVKAGWANQGCRVWTYRQTDKGVRKKEVLHGTQGKSKDGKPLTVVISVLQDTQVIYSEGKSVDTRVRYAVENALDDKALFLVVVPCRGTDPSFAKDYAERLCGVDGIEGLPCAGASSLPLPPRFAADKAWRAQRRKMTPEELTAGETVTFALASNNTTSKILLGEIEDESEKFYLVRRGNRTRDFGNGSYMVRDYRRDTVFEALQIVLKQIGIDFTGVVLVETEGAARRLKLAEQGYRPLLSWSLEQIRENWGTLLAKVDRSPRAYLRKYDTASNFGLMGVLAHHLLLRTPFWEVLEPKLVGHPLLEAVADFAIKADTTANTYDELGPMVRALDNVVNCPLPTHECERLTHSDVTHVFKQAYPSAEVLHLFTLNGLMARAPEKAATMLMTVLSLDTASKAAEAKVEVKADVEAEVEAEIDAENAEAQESLPMAA